MQLISVRWWNATAYYAISLAKVLNQAGHPAIVAGSGENPPLTQAKKQKLPIFGEINLESKNPLRLIDSYYKLKNFLQSNEIHILNAHRPEDHLFGVVLSRRLEHIPLIRTIGDVRSPKNNPINKWLHLKGTDFFIFSSIANKKRYQNIWPIRDQKCAVIYAPVDVQHFHFNLQNTKLREQINIAKDKVVFGVIGRLSPVKDHKTFLRAAAILHKKKPNTHFLISGKSVEITHRELRDLARDLGIASCTHILDEMNDVRDAISTVDVGVVSSNGSEAICRIAAEFMAMQKPVIATGVNVLPEMITDNLEGFIVPAQNPHKMAEKMELLASEKILRIEMGKRARKTAVNHFSQETFLEKTIQVYHHVLENKRIAHGRKT